MDVKNHIKISLIAALSENRVIGRENKLPWYIPGELKRFKEITMGHPIVMGRKTFESIGRVLPGRTNIVITRDSTWHHEGVVVTHSLDEAIEKAINVIARNLVKRGTKQSFDRAQNISQEEIATSSSTPRDDASESEIFIIGGGQIFEEAITKADKLYLTLVHTTLDGDTFFPDYSEFQKVVFQQDGEAGGYRYTFLDLERS